MMDTLATAGLPRARKFRKKYQDFTEFKTSISKQKLGVILCKIFAKCDFSVPRKLLWEIFVFLKKKNTLFPF